MNSQIVELFCDTVHRTTVIAVVVERFDATAAEAQFPCVATRVLGTAPVVADFTTVVQRPAAAPEAGGQQHQVITKKTCAAVVGRTA